MWAITSYYNPVRYKRRLSNYKIFRANLGIPLVAVELSFDGHFELTEGDADILVQISGGAVLWQKERLLNIAIRSVPRNVTNIAWVDCDIIFERSDWMNEAELQLSNANIVQPFSDLVDLTSAGYQASVNYRDIRPSGRGVTSVINASTPAAPDDISSPLVGVRSLAYGAAWASRRDIVEHHGFYDAMIAGGGDQAMADAIYGQFEKTTHALHLNSARQQHYLKWARPYQRAVAEKIGNVPGRLYHLWHGQYEKRSYFDRHRLLAGLDFEPDADLVIGSNGAWQWARSRPELEGFLADYFISRTEDD